MGTLHDIDLKMEENNMKAQMVQNIMQYLINKLPEEYMSDFRLYLYYQFSEYDITKKCTEVAVIEEKTYEDYLNLYLGNLLITGRSEKTEKQYRMHLQMLLEKLDKPIQDITSDDLLTYLALYKVNRKVSNRYLNSLRVCFNSFFGWLYRKNYIVDNPAKAIEYIKFEKKIKKPYTDEEREILRCYCKSERELAIIDVLYSSGMRIGELVRLNRQDIHFDSKDCVVFGKGKKERKVYISAAAAYHLKNYLESRTDDNPALFVSKGKPFNRLSEHGVRQLLQRLGKRAGIEHVHPHRYRTTAATNAINRGMPVQEVQMLLGHEDIGTTMMYCAVSSDNVQSSHRKYLAA